VYVCVCVCELAEAAKGPQGCVQGEDRRLPYYKYNSSCGLPRLHDHDPATREDLSQRGLPWYRARSSGALSWGFNAARGRCSAQLRVQNKMTRISS
jgi:hypothetical protein